ncbi:Uroporphyrinogen-III synthase [Candidatus Bealeia paramacronuclearis]|uniref:Uroporphyrinogen-III synthase n=1 Tax=Candidatus Bealeia paramacronuclearis TaxID=1921001 RepID=A0ABZ2C0I0_9PROT|nr:Uroporphyrinogen-III synthase [Candidatus Bealeia paramacronuclearis]
MQYFLLTRPQEDSERLVPFLEMKGYTPIIEPLLHPVYLKDFILTPPELQAIIVTSKHALKSLEASQKLALFEKTPLICVGEKTAELAKNLGIETVLGKCENGDQLLSWIQKNVIPELGSLLYLHGDVVRQDLKSAISPQGYRVQAQKIYEMKESQALSPKVLDLFHRKVFQGIAFFSPRTAKIFVKISNKFNLYEKFSTVHAFCLSQSIANEIKSMPWQGVEITNSATEKSLMELL